MSSFASRFCLSGMDKEMNARMMLIDIHKTFDKLDHKIIVREKTCLGFKTSLTKWFESYLSSRKSSASVDDIFLEAGTFSCDVPLWSILMLLLLLIYINDIPQLLSESGFRSVNWLHVPERVVSCLATTVFKCLNGIASRYINSMFQPLPNMYSTRLQIR